MSTRGQILSLSQVAKELGIARATVAGMVTALGLTIERVPCNGMAKGLSPASVRKIKSRLTKSVAS